MTSCRAGIPNLSSLWHHGETDRANEIIDEIRSLTSAGMVSIGRCGRSGICLCDHRIEEIGELSSSPRRRSPSTLEDVYPGGRLVVAFCDPTVGLSAPGLGEIRPTGLEPVSAA